MIVLIIHINNHIIFNYYYKNGKIKGLPHGKILMIFKLFIILLIVHCHYNGNIINYY